MTDYESVTRKPGYWWVCHGDQKQWEVVEVDEQDRIWWPGREQEDWTDGPEVDVWGPYLGRTPNTESQSVARETSTVDGVIYAQHPGSTGDANYRNDGSTAAQTTECKSVDHSGLLSGLLAVIHRDGGHREHAVGTEQAVREAMDIVPRLLGASDDAECRSAFVADVSRQLRNALAVGSWDMVEQLLADIEPTDCGSVGGEDGE